MSSIHISMWIYIYVYTHAYTPFLLFYLVQSLLSLEGQFMSHPSMYAF